MSDADPVGIVSDLWRFPVKSLGGERVRRTFIGPFGPIGDRRYALGVDGEVVSARRQTRILGYRAHYADAAGVDEVRVTTPDGRVMAIDDHELAMELTDLIGAEVTMHRGQSFPDIAPLHLVTVQSLGALAEAVGMDLDVRRFRPNVVVEATREAPWAEAAWVGRRLAIGETVEVEVVLPTERCAVTTVDPDDLHRDTRVLATIARERENLFGVYGRVTRSGWVAAGDQVRLLPS